MRKPVFGFPTRSDTNRAVQMIARALKFQIWVVEVVEGLYYLYSENKGADQLCSYCAADLRLCLRMHAKSRFSHKEVHIYEVLYFICFSITII